MMRPSRTRLAVLVGGLAAAMLIFGLACKSASAKLANTYSARLSLLLGGGTRDDAAREFGMPMTRQPIGTSEAREYRTSKDIVTAGGTAFRPPLYPRELLEKLTDMLNNAGILRSRSLEAQDSVVESGSSNLHKCWTPKTGQHTSTAVAQRQTS
jgi:hypothetical protein